MTFSLSVLDLFASWQCWLALIMCAAAAPFLSLIWSILFPTVLSYPWEEPPKRSSTPDDTVVLAGSFNPPHYGHYAMLKYLSKRHSKVICVVGMNPDKKYDVTPQERANLLRTMFNSNNNNDTHNNIEVQVVTGYIWRFAKTRRCKWFYRGIRTWAKDGGEERSLQILNTWGPLMLGPTWPIPTVYLEGQPEYNHISSTLIRTLVAGGADNATIQKELKKLVPESIAEQVQKLYSRGT